MGRTIILDIFERICQITIESIPRGVIVLIKDLVTNILGKTVEPKIESYAVELADSIYYDKQIKEKVCAYLLKKYGNEVYYNDLDGYITANNVIDLLFKAIRGKSNAQPQTERQFKNLNAKRFIEHNPQYRRNKVVSSRIPGIFGEIFNIVVTSVMSLNPHSDHGKLQRTMEISTATILGGQQVIDSKLDKILENIQERQPLLVANGIADIATEAIGKCPEDVALVTQKIKEIEKEYQKKHRFSDALSRYYELLQNIASTLIGYSQEEVNTLICILNCNIALCQVNIGLPEKAFQSLLDIPPDTASKSKVYHFVYALLYVQQNDIENYSAALSHIDAALKIDPNYHSAFIVRQFLLVNLHQEKAQNALHDMEEHFDGIISKGEDRDNIVEYYQFHGLINMYADFYSEAIEDFNSAETYGYDPVYTKLNIAATMYCEATAAVPKGQRLLAPSVNQSVLLKAITLLNEIIDAIKSNVDYDNVCKRAVTLYTSACAAIGKKHDLSPVDDYIYEGLEYEDLRSILLGASEALTDSQLSLLEPEDRVFCTVRDMMDSGNGEACREYIIGLIEKGNQNVSAPVFHVLLQTCLMTKSSNDYWKFRSSAGDYGICGDVLESMDACAFELDGNLRQAKLLFDKIALSSADDNILENTLRFYFRNNCTDEIRALFLRMHELIITKSMYIANAELLYQDVNKFFIARRDPVIEKILSELPAQLVSAKCRLQLYASYYSATCNSPELLNCLTELSCADGEFTNAYNTALCATRLLKYDKAINICYSLEERTEKNDDKVKLFWLISDILLLQGNLDDSFLWAKKAHEFTSTNPYDRSHQAFLARAFRCNHREAFEDILEYKEEHPVVVNWLYKFSVPESEEDVVSCIQNALDEFAPDHASYLEHEKQMAKLYKQGVVPISMILKWYDGNILRLFSFAMEHKLNLAQGNYEKLMDDCKRLRQAVVVDALTLIIIAYHSCLPAFDGFSQVYVNYGSIATIQQLFLSYGFDCLSDILTWFRVSSNVVFEPNGFTDEESAVTEIFSSDFTACCSIAYTYKIPYLYCDVTAWRFQQIPELGVDKNIEFISIPAVCYKSFANDQEMLAEALYGLLRDATFINFNAGTILHQIRKQNYNVSKELMAPFMCCTSTCDMHSFAAVYLSAVEALNSENPDAAVALADIVLEDAFKIWKRGTYYRQLVETIPNAEAEYKAKAISKYVVEILQGVERIFNGLPSDLSIPFKTLSTRTGYIIG